MIDSASRGCVLDMKEAIGSARALLIQKLTSRKRLALDLSEEDAIRIREDWKTQNPELHAKQKEKQREHDQRPDVKQKAKERRQRPDMKQKVKERKQRPDVKQKDRERQQRPDVKQKAKEYYDSLKAPEKFQEVDKLRREAQSPEDLRSKLDALTGVTLTAYQDTINMNQSCNKKTAINRIVQVQFGPQQPQLQIYPYPPYPQYLQTYPQYPQAYTYPQYPLAYTPYLLYPPYPQPQPQPQLNAHQKYKYNTSAEKLQEVDQLRREAQSPGLTR